MSTFVKLLKGVIPLTKYPYTGQSVPCGLCGSDEKQTICEYDRRIKKLRTVICMNCGLQRTDPMPTEAELADYYRLSYRFDYQLAGSKPPKFHLKRSKDHAKARYARLAPVLPANTKLLDFGSGSGEFLAECKSHGHDVTGIEPGQTYAKFATDTYGVSVHASPWNEVDLGDAKFDAITSFHVFEHLCDPLAALKWLASHLKEGGVVALAVPDMSPNPSGPKFFELLHFAHVYGFAPETLELLGAYCGLEVETSIPMDGADIVFRKPKSPKNGAKPDPAFAAITANSFDKTDIVGHMVRGGWVVDGFKRAGRDIRDTFKSK